MSFNMSVDHERKEVEAIALGPITYIDTVNHLLNERHFAGFVYKEFLDARDADFSWTQEEMRDIVATVQNLSGELNFGPTAVLVSTDVAFGTVRMLQMLIENFAEVRPFRDEQEARLADHQIDRVVSACRWPEFLSSKSISF